MKAWMRLELPGKLMNASAVWIFNRQEIRILVRQNVVDNISLQIYVLLTVAQRRVRVISSFRFLCMGSQAEQNHGPDGAVDMGGNVHLR